MFDKADSSGSAFAARFSLGTGTGPLVAVKDCIDIDGMTTRCGCAALSNAPAAARNAVIVDRLLEAGCRIVGKTRMHELAYGMTGINAFEGTPLNPKWPARIPGGSSSGSAAAVAAGEVAFAIGTDTGGSVRQPAICCGVIGLKPTFGRLDRTGVLPAKSSLDCVGIFARSLLMVEYAMSVLDPDFTPEAVEEEVGIARLCIGQGADPRSQGVDPRMAEAQENVRAGAGDGIETVELPLLDDAFAAGLAIIGRETLAANRHLLESDAPLGADVRGRLERARLLTDADVAHAEDVRQRFTAEIDAVLARYDAILTPALPLVPPLLADAGDPSKVLSLTRFLRPFNLSGHPAIVLPAATPDGLPSGVQLVGRKGDDARLIALARRLSETNAIFQMEGTTR